MIATPYHKLEEAMLRRIMIVTVMTICSFTVSARNIHVASDVWCPYVCDTQPGYLVEIVQRAFESQGDKVVFTQMPFKRALKEAQVGNIDAVLAITEPVAKANKLLITDTKVGNFSNDFFVVKNNPWTYHQLSDLNQQSMAVIKGYDYGHELKPYLQQHKALFFASGEDPLSMNIIRLIKGRHKVIVDNRHVIEYTAKQLGLIDKIQYAGSMPDKQSLYIGFNAHQEAALKRFALGVTTIKQSGEYQQILDKYQIAVDSDSIELKKKRSTAFL